MIGLRNSSSASAPTIPLRIMDTMIAVNHLAKSDSCLLVETVVDRAVEALSEDDDEMMVAVESDDAEAELNDDRIAETETEEADTGCKYANSNPSSLQGFGKILVSACNTLSLLLFEPRYCSLQDSTIFSSAVVSSSSRGRLVHISSIAPS